MIWYWLLGGAAAAGVMLLARSAYERRHFEVCRWQFYTAAVEGPVKFVVLSDLHDWSFGEDNEELLRAVREETPDFVLLAGDMMTVKPWKNGDFQVCESLLAGLAAEFPVYYGSGNHELRMKRQEEEYPGWYSRFSAFLRKQGICYLEDETVAIPQPHGRVLISGLDLDERFYTAKFKTEPMEDGYVEERLGPCCKEKGDYQILLAHSPLYFPNYARWGADLVLSGHFHGGTIRLPGVGGLMSPQYQMFPKWDRGLYEYGGSRMIVSAGLGTHSINIRLNNRPTLISVELRKE